MRDELMEAAKAGDAARVREIIDHDPAQAATTGGSAESPLMAALYRGHTDLARVIGDAAERAGHPLDLFAAAALGRGDALKRALDTGAPVNGYAYDGWTPLHLAAFFGHRPAVELLLEAGAEISASSRNAMTNTPLHAAVAGGHGDVAILLLERGASVDAADAGGHTPLHIAAEGGNVPVVRALLERGADPHVVDAEDKTPLSRAAARNHAAIVDLINVAR